MPGQLRRQTQHSWCNWRSDWRLAGPAPDMNMNGVRDVTGRTSAGFRSMRRRHYYTVIQTTGSLRDTFIMPRPLGGGIKRWCCLVSDVCLSVCLSVAYIGPRSRTERFRKTKIGTEVAHVTHDSETISRSRSQGWGHIVAASRTACLCKIFTFLLTDFSKFFTFITRSDQRIYLDKKNVSPHLKCVYALGLCYLTKCLQFIQLVLQ